MAMLAETRRKKRYCMPLKQKALYEDDARFGTKMLEKMGWSKGKGLGANEDGSQEFLQVRYKNDVKGVGFAERSDQWTQHEQDFNGFLKNLNGEDASNAEQSSADEQEQAITAGFGFAQTVPIKNSKVKSKKLKEEISGVSLEERSKQSRARVHYKKYTKGKDLSQYTEEDLANIFGRKADNSEQLEKASENDIFAQLAKTLAGAEQTAEEPAKEKPATEEEQQQSNFAGVQTISTGLSISDYFKQKMEERKNKLKTDGQGENDTDNVNTRSEAAGDVAEPKVKKKKKRADIEFVEETVVVDAEKTQKKCNKHLIETAKIQTEIVDESGVDDAQIKKKKKRCKHATAAENCIVSEDNESPKQKKSKCKEIEIQTEVVPEILVDGSKSKKQNKRRKDVATAAEKKNKSKATLSVTKEISTEIAQEAVVDRFEEKREKYRTKKPAETVERIICIEDETPKKSKVMIPAETIEVEPLIENGKKKKSKQKLEKNHLENGKIENVVDLTAEEEVIEEEPAKKNKKRKNKNPADVNEERQVEMHGKTAEKTHLQNVEENSKKNIFVDVEMSAVNANAGKNVTAVKMQQSIEELQAKVDAYNVLSISTFVAEKFRVIDLSQFKGANANDITGYGVDEDIKLDIKTSKVAEERILKLWGSRDNKYEVETEAAHGSQEKNYKTFISQMRTARHAHKKAPRLNCGTWKRKNAFGLL